MCDLLMEVPLVSLHDPQLTFYRTTCHRGGRPTHDHLSVPLQEISDIVTYSKPRGQMTWVNNRPSTNN